MLTGCLIWLVLVVPSAAPPTLRSFLDALAEVETGGQPDPAEAVGDFGRSLGPYQITWKYWKDSGVSGRYQWVRNKTYAERVVVAYWQRYCPESLARRDWRTLARVHNGGPDGVRVVRTYAYWRRVQAAMR